MGTLAGLVHTTPVIYAGLPEGYAFPVKSATIILVF